MTNQVGKVHTQPGDEVLCESTCHILTTVAASVLIPGAQAKLVVVTEGNECRQVEGCPSAVPSWEEVFISRGNMKSSGEVYKKIVHYHADGARIFNGVAVCSGEVNLFGLFPFVCRVWDRQLDLFWWVRKSSFLARRVRKVLAVECVKRDFGGGWNLRGQSCESLQEDHNRCKVIGEVINKLPYIAMFFRETNIDTISTKNSLGKFVKHYLIMESRQLVLEASDSFCNAFGFTEEMLEKTVECFGPFNPRSSDCEFGDEIFFAVIEGIWSSFYFLNVGSSETNQYLK